MRAGRIVQCRLEGDGIVTVLRHHRSSETANIATRWIINCSGPLRDFTRIDDRLVRGLFEQGHIATDVLRLGLDITPDNRLLSRDGRPWDNLYALGPPTLGAYWEIIAVPDLRNACAAFAKILAQRLRTRR
jgi:uncharacterized NAD(P)/FAD-binding protein YdhS